MAGGRFEVGNPGGPGRPKGSISLKDLIDEELQKITKAVPDPETGVRVRVDAKRMVVRKLILESLGNSKDWMAAYKLWSERSEGMPAETLQVQGTGELNIRIVPMTKDDLRDSGNVEVNEYVEPPDPDGLKDVPGAAPGAGGTGT